MTTNTVLIADDDAELLKALTLRIEKLGLEVHGAPDGLEALLLAAKDPPGLLIIDVDLPAADGFSVCEKLTQDDRIEPFPVIFLTGKSDEETIQRCKSLGARYFHKGLDVWDNLKPAICELLRVQPESTGMPAAADATAATATDTAEAPGKPKVLVVDDDQHILRALKIRLGALGVDVIAVMNAKQGYRIALAEMPDVIITDLTMPEMCGDTLVLKLNTTPETKDIPVIVLTGRTFDGRKDYAMERNMTGRLGCVAYLSKPLDFDALIDLMSQHIRLDTTYYRPQAAAMRQ